MKTLCLLGIFLLLVSCGSESSDLDINTLNENPPAPKNNKTQVTLLEGPGQVLTVGRSLYPPPTVKVVKTDGQPLTGVKISWELNSSFLKMNSGSFTQTNMQGIANAPNISSQGSLNDYASSLLIAKVYLEKPVDFEFPILVQPKSANGFVYPDIRIQTNYLSQNVVETNKDSIFENAFSIQANKTSGLYLGRSLPNLGFKVVAYNDSGQINDEIKCNTEELLDRFLLTNNLGVAYCDLHTGSEKGTFQIWVHVGGFSQQYLYHLKVH